MARQVGYRLRDEVRISRLESGLSSILMDLVAQQEGIEGSAQAHRRRGSCHLIAKTFELHPQLLKTGGPKEH